MEVTGRKVTNPQPSERGLIDPLPSKTNLRGWFNPKLFLLLSTEKPWIVSVQEERVDLLKLLSQTFAICFISLRYPKSIYPSLVTPEDGEEEWTRETEINYVFCALVSGGKLSQTLEK